MAVSWECEIGVVILEGSVEKPKEERWVQAQTMDPSSWPRLVQPCVVHRNDDRSKYWH